MATTTSKDHTSETTPSLLPAYVEEITNIETFVTTIQKLSDCITKAVSDGKSVTAAKKRLINLAAEEIRRCGHKLTSMSTVLAPANNPPPQSNMNSDLKADIVACVRSEMAKLKGQITTQLQQQARPASYAQAAATSSGPGSLPSVTTMPPARGTSNNKPAIVVTPKVTPKSRQEAIEAFKKSISYRTANYAPARVQAVSNHKLRVEFDTTEQRNDTLQKLKSSEHVSVEPAKGLRPMIILKGGYQIALLSEPYVGSGNEVRPTQGLNIHQFGGKGRVKACILTKPGCGQVIGMSQYSNSNLCVIQFTSGGHKILIASAYIEPNSDENNTLEHIDNFLKISRCPNTIIGGDFNGWHHLWGSKTNNPRGCAVVELAHANDLFVCNVGTSPTFETVTHGRDRASIIDLTLAHGHIFDRVVGWKVNLNACPSSQHNAVEYEIATENSSLNSSSITNSTFKYNSNKANWGIFKDALHTLMTNTDILERDIGSLNTAGLEKLIDDICGIIHKACEESMPTKKGRSLTKHRPLWWTEKLTDLKKEVIQLHHRLNRMRRRNLPLDQLAEELNNKKAIYAEELRAESSRSFREFCELQTKENVWTLTNRLLKDTAPKRPPATIKIGDNYTSSETETAQALLDHFYGDDTPDNDTHQHQFLRSRIGNEPDGVDEPPFAVEEVLEHLKWMNPKKAPGIDGLTSDICLQFTINYPELITGIMNRCLELHHFPQQWKRAEVKIIPKPSKTDYSELSSFRPIGLLPVFGKLLEKLYIKRLIYCATKAGLLNGRQFGFKEQTSTITAIDTALSIVKAAKKNGKQVLGVSLDIRSAFDNAWWPALFERLRAIRCPKNIFHLIESYTTNRTLTLEYAGARVTKNNTKGCIQGSACGPILWNVILDELLEAELPSGCHLQAFADDVLLIVSAKDVNTLQTNTNRALEIILEWGQSVKLTFGPTKTQAIAFTRKAEEAHLIMGRHTLAFQRSIKFLGMIIDRKLLFADHVKYVVGKAMRIFNKLCIYTRPTWGAHPDNVQTIYRQVIEPTITYAAAAQVDLNFIFSWAKGHAGDAGNEIADETAKGAATQHKTPDYAKFPMSFVKRTMREKTWRTWQTRYESAEQGARTKELLPKLTDICALWKATKVSFQLTQALTGHGYHKEYLHRFKIAADPFCPCDNTTTQTLTHLLRECPRFEYNRLRHEMLCSNLRISPYCVTELSNKQSAIESFVTFINYIIDKLKGFNKL
ncbi:unnamed protein product [Parnassius apollo]|uniref:(apollo) hypothetical protein n=2 Tax=Parnassius apollo TaxID=110799 RepID=A0A8S3WAD7_PARAO|nr:unnamed protein product [Parnassius apollo]